jgi:ELWxxDGT repeat protein
MRQGRAVLVALLAALPAVATAAASAIEPVLVRDLDPRPHDPIGSGTLPGQFFRAGARTVFAQQDASYVGPSALWATDGTAAGTERLRSFPGHLRLLGAAGDVAFFATPVLVNDAHRDPIRLWRTDGTREGTFPLGVGPGFERGSEDPTVVSALVFGDALLFSGCTPAWGCEPWRSDGTPAGTRRLREIVPGTGGSAPHGFVAFQGHAFFLADEPAGTGLWRTDGTRPGTQPVISLPPFSSPRGLFVQGDRLYFTAGAGDYGGTVGPHLWTSDGTAAGTRPVPPFASSRDGRSPQVISLAAGLGDRAVFVGVRGKGDFQLWITDPAARSAHPLTHVAPLPHGGYLPFGHGAAVNGRLVFTIDSQLWASRGTFGDTRRLAGCPGGCPAQAMVWGALPDSPGQLLVSGGDAASGFALWTTDGTAAGTRKRVDLCTGPCASAPELAGFFLGQAFFYFEDRLWATDGTSGGTRPLADHPVPTPYNAPPPIGQAGDRVFFPVFSDATGTELWTSDGTPRGTAFLARQEDGAGSLPQGIAPFAGGVLFFTCIDGVGQPWSSDGTRDGTLRLPGSTDCQRLGSTDPPPRFVRLGGAAFYTAWTDDFVSQLWRTDGTPQGTAPFFRPADDEVLVSVGTFRGQLFFATVAAREIRFWTSDGTAAGTARLFTLPGQYAFGFTPVGDRLLFVAEDANGFSFDLLVTDGTAEGTRVLLADQGSVPDPIVSFGGAFWFLSDGLVRTDLTPEGTSRVLPNAASPTPFFDLRGLAAVAGSLVFVAQTGSPDDDLPGDDVLYRSDGTVAGTAPLRVLDAASQDFPSALLPVVAGPFLYFAAADAEHGEELWRTDGTAAGTLPVADLFPGAEPSDPRELTADGDRLLFTADDGEHGHELWVTRGVPGDPQPLGRRTDGTLSLEPLGLTVAGDRLFFSADDSVNGRELWLLPLSPNKP